MSIRKLEFEYDKLFEISKKANLTRRLEEELYDFKNFLNDHYDFKIVLEDPRISATYKKDKVRRIVPENVTPLFLSVVALLIDRGREDLIADLSEGFTRKVFKNSGEALAEITSVIPLNEKALNKIGNIMEKISKRKVVLRNIIKKKVLGGLLIKLFPDRIFDLTLKHRLSELETNIRKELINV